MLPRETEMAYLVDISHNAHICFVDNWTWTDSFESSRNRNRFQLNRAVKKWSVECFEQSMKGHCAIESYRLSKKLIKKKCHLCDNCAYWCETFVYLLGSSSGSSSLAGEWPGVVTGAL